jgi:hypothetical protein
VNLITGLEEDEEKVVSEVEVEDTDEGFYLVKYTGEVGTAMVEVKF